MGCVYLVTNMMNGKMYVEKTTRTMSFRRQQHEHDSTSVATNSPFHNALRKYGFDAFKWERLYRSNDNEKLLEREIFYIKLLGTKGAKGYNLTDGGQGPCGYKHSEKTRARLAIACKGWKHTPEAKAKIGAAFVGRVFSPEHLAKIGAALKGRKYTPETIARMRAAKLGKHQTAEHIAKRVATTKARRKHKSKD